MTHFSALFVGNESLVIQCAELWLAAGHRVTAMVTRNDEVARWARARGLSVEAQDGGLAGRVAGLDYDWLFSVANLHILPRAMVEAAHEGAVNFHDGPLPRHAGLNAPVWALLERETRHGIAWHRIEGGVDEGAILQSRDFDIAEGETALTLNTKCFEAAIDSFGALVAAIGSGTLSPRPQDLAQRSWHGRDDRPAAAARVDFTGDAGDVLRLVRALDHGGYWNPLSVPKIAVGGRVLAVGAAEIAESAGAPGTVLAADEAGLTVACGAGAVTLRALRDLEGRAVCPMSLDVVGAALPSPDAAEVRELGEAMAAVAAGDGHWRDRLRSLRPAELPLAGPATDAADWRRAPCDIADGDVARGAVALAIFAHAYGGGEPVDLAFHHVGAPVAPGYLSDWVPLRAGAGETTGAFLEAFKADLALAVRFPAFAADLPLRDPAIGKVGHPAIALNLGEDAPLDGSLLTLAISAEGAAVHYDAARLDPRAAEICAERIAHLATILSEAHVGTALAALPAIPESERALLVEDWNRSEAEFEADLCVHQAFEAQVARTPDAVALVHEARSLTYAELNAHANRAAHVLISMGVGPGTLVGLCTRRSPLLMIGALAIQKAGGAYVPLDPAYPEDRIALYVEDSACPVIVTETALAATLPQSDAALLTLDDDPRLAAAEDGDPDSGVTGKDLAYMIYTSGSTGRPKGVMIEHRNVQNFFVGMDAHIRHDPAGTWLAVTSLSFDISVLELFWTLARGFRVVVMGDADRALVSGGGGTSVSARGMEFSLYYWGNDDGAGPAKYDLLLEGAKFADKNGFCAVWTPERHFHAFGGPYPNPSVTGAAVAAVTGNISVRAGSCVAPLHHPARIAEEWAVIDNLTNGRAGLAIASGWQPDDFVLRPENTPPANKPAMFDAIDKVRRLWRGEAVEFPTASGTPFAVVTQPRPVSKEVPVWVTTAGNPETWREAGAVGANVLTHLLGQSIDEVADKIKLYHKALREAGHDPADRTVTLMLHTYVAADRDAARETARGPMKDYLRSAAGLIKQYAWAFPAFKKPQGVSNPMEIDLRSLTEEEMEGVLDFAFQRYFEDSGLFGTVEDCVERVEDLKRIGVDEIACLIDYGIPSRVVLEGLVPLAEVLRRANEVSAEVEEDFSIAAQIARYGVTHLQCTPSMARMLAMNPESREALAGVSEMMVGGEALPGALVEDLAQATGARILNMYGPTETTIWSAVDIAEPGAAVSPVGHPIANTQLYVLGPDESPVPLGVAGELWIGGDGVARGYWKRDDLTEERFRPDPFTGKRMYRTGDLVRQRADGRFDFLGRMDHQVKIRGYRIELGEIEAQAEAAPGVRQAVVVAREDVPGDVRLVAYVTADAGFASDALNGHLKARLPVHMVPAHIVRLDAMPLTPNEKVDRKALPAPGEAPAEEAPAAAYVAPSSGAEETIAAIWRRILNLPSVGAEDNFFALGGHSLLAVQAHREIREALGATRLSITDIFRFPTLSALARHLDDRPAQPAETGHRLHFGGAVTQDRAAMRADAMSKRRALRAGRGA